MAKILKLVCLFIVLAIVVSPLAADEPPPPAFIFGDSTADVGTNDYVLGSGVTANFPHNGVDFPNHRATGRFSNGFISADFIAMFLGLKRSPPPFLFLLTLEHHHFEKHLTRGVNFASAGSGLFDETGANLSVVPMSEQINQFSTVRDNLTAMINSSQTADLLSKSLFFISVGSNDIFGYFITNSTIPPPQFIASLISTYANHITNLYKLGARKFGIISVPPVGCCPSQRVVQKLLYGVDGCFQPENDFAQSFYKGLDSLLVNISSQLPGFKYSLGNGYNMTLDVINDPTRYGFEVVDSACCGSGYLNATGKCNRAATLCADRRNYLFWDLFHPTTTAAFLAAKTLYSGPTYYVSPINFSQLAKEN